MSIKEKLASNAEKTNARLEREDKQRSWHSAYYHRYFEGWTEVSEPKPSGRGMRIKRIYTGPYFKADMSARERAARKVVYALLVILSIALYVKGGYVSLESNMVWYVVLPQAVCLCGNVFLVWFLLLKLFSPEMLVIREYKETSKNLKLTALVQAVLLGITALGTLLHLVLNRGNKAELLAAALFVCAACACLVLHLLEKGVKYLRISNPNTPEDGFTILHDEE